MTLPLPMRIKYVLISLAIFILGILLGGYLFSKTQPRSFLALNNCQQQCLNTNELAGLVGSVVMNSAPLLLAPVVIMETDKTVVIKNPVPEAATDFVVIPKKDIKDAGELSDADKPYLIDAYAVIQRLIEREGLKRYEVTTYGPGRQQVRYLHFHLKSVD